MESYTKTNFAPEVLEKEVQSSLEQTWIARRSGQLVGYLRMILTSRCEAHPEISGVEVRRLYLLKDYYGKGIAHKLMTQVYRAAQVRSEPLIWLGVWEKNDRAFRFYQKLGFEVAGELDFILGADLQRDWVMKKRLV